MSDLTVYSFEDEDGPEGSYQTENLWEARDYARKGRLAIVANEYEWVDDEIVEDYRPTQAEAPE